MYHSDSDGQLLGSEQVPGHLRLLTVIRSSSRVALLIHRSDDTVMSVYVPNTFDLPRAPFQLEYSLLEFGCRVDGTEGADDLRVTFPYGV